MTGMDEIVRRAERQIENGENARALKTILEGLRRLEKQIQERRGGGGLGSGEKSKRLDAED
jgi:hypothetical protein